LKGFFADREGVVRGGVGGGEGEELLVAPGMGLDGRQTGGHGSEGGASGDVESGGVEVAEVVDGSGRAVEFGEEIGEAGDGIGEDQAFAVHDGAELGRVGVPAGVGIPGGEVFQDNDRSVGKGAAPPAEGFGDEVTAKGFGGEETAAKGGGDEEGVEAFFVGEELEGTFFDRDEGAGSAVVGQEAVDGEEIVEGQGGSVLEDEGEFGFPGDGREIGRRSGGFEGIAEEGGESGLGFEGDEDAVDEVGAEPGWAEDDEAGGGEGAGVAIGIGTKFGGEEAGVCEELFPVAGEGAGGGVESAAAGAPPLIVEFTKDGVGSPGGGIGGHGEGVCGGGRGSMTITITITITITEEREGEG
jgi:hypothetical protein